MPELHTSDVSLWSGVSLPVHENPVPSWQPVTVESSMHVLTVVHVTQQYSVLPAAAVPTLHTSGFDSSGESLPVHDHPAPWVHVTVESALHVLDPPSVPLSFDVPEDVLLTVHPAMASASPHDSISASPRMDMTKPPSRATRWTDDAVGVIKARYAGQREGDRGNSDEPRD